MESCYFIIICVGVHVLSDGFECDDIDDNLTAIIHSLIS
jgi:hypothetical protein